ncbi:MAG: hypothetical protein DCC55_10280 [Chloroflexi bacterium]|nr:MAG: hypothetical protein DCC55_10280 [Chloroflexota bacterium]
MRGCLYVIFVRPFALLLHAIWDLLNLIPYLLVVLALWLVFGYFVWGGFSLPGGFNPFGWFNREPAMTQTAPRPSPAADTAEGVSLVFRFLWQGERIYYLGNEITEEYFAELAREARELNGKVEVQQASDVTVETADRRRAILDEVGVNYEIIPR